MASLLVTVTLKVAALMASLKVATSFLLQNDGWYEHTSNSE